MTFLLALLALAGTPHIGTPATSRQPDGTWKCSAVCLTAGNIDGGYCRVPVVSRRKPTEKACTDDLEAQCAKTKPPPGGCHWDGRPTGGK